MVVELIFENFHEECRAAQLSIVNYLNLLWKNDGEASAAINRVGEEREGAGVLGEDVANEQEPKSLTLWFCGIERSEEMWSNFRGNATTVIGDNE